MSIIVDTIDLSLTSPDTGEYLTANVYYVDGVTNADGSLRALSIGGVVMAICLNRAADLENGYTDPATGKHVEGIIEIMEGLNKTSAQLEALTEIETEVLTWPEKYSNNRFRSLLRDRISADNVIYANKTYREVLIDTGFMEDSDGKEYVRWKGDLDDNDIDFDEFIDTIESVMDEKNSFSQQTMIQLQSQTNKRDQAYDMISNILKSLNTVMTSTVNNI